MQLEVMRTAEFQGRRYYLLQGHPGGDAWLRWDGSGSVLAYDAGTTREQLWYAFWNKPGEPYQTFLPGSVNSPAVVRSTSEVYSGPIGWCNQALELQYPGVFQVGISRELFLPYVGLVRREQAVGGPAVVVWDLIYSRLGGVTYVAEEGVTFGLTLDRSVYGPNGEMIARLTLHNGSWEPLSVDFPTSQSFDIVLRNEKGERVYAWSADKSFLDVYRTVALQHGEWNFPVLIPLSAGGRPLAAGRYTAEAWLTTLEPISYAASAEFEIADATNSAVHTN
jgi:hypothetical protein